MPKQNIDPLVALIGSLSKAEKRNFKLFAKKSNSSLEEAKFIMLFDLIDKTKEYSDDLPLTVRKSVKGKIPFVISEAEPTSFGEE